METGTVRLLMQLPYRMPTLIAAKLAAVIAAWLVAAIPAASALALWRHLAAICTHSRRFNLLLGHLLYGLLIGAIALVRGLDRRKRCDRRDHDAGGHDRLLGA